MDMRRVRRFELASPPLMLLHEFSLSESQPTSGAFCCREPFLPPSKLGSSTWIPGSTWLVGGELASAFRIASMPLPVVDRLLADTVLHARSKHARWRHHRAPGTGRRAHHCSQGSRKGWMRRVRGVLTLRPRSWRWGGTP